MLKFLRNLTLNTKFIIITVGVLLFIFSILATVIYRTQKNEIIATTDDRMYSQIEDLRSLMEIEYKYKQEIIERGSKISLKIIKENGGITRSEEKTVMIVSNLATGSKKKIELDQWYVNNKMLQKNDKLINNIEKFTHTEVSLFQKFPDGFVRISTTERAIDNSSLKGAYLPNTSRMVQAMNRDKSYSGRIMMDRHWYIGSFKPLKFKGIVRGAIFNGVKENSLSNIRSKFKEKSYFNTGFPFAMSSTGMYLIHPIYETQYNKNVRVLDYVKTNKRGKYRYRFPDNKNGIIKITYFSYYEPLDMVIGATVDESQLLDKPLSKVRNTLIIAFLSALIFCLVGIAIVISSITKVINKLVTLLQNMAKGKQDKKIIVRANDEIGKMASSVNSLLGGFQAYTSFAQEIGKGNLQTSFRPLSEEDTLGNSLIEMRDNLEKLAKEERNRKWITEGLTIFSDVLRQHNDNIQKLSYEIISNLVSYLDANQGGIFTLNTSDPDPNNQFLEMIACFAYDKRKMLKKEVKIGEGFIGQAFKEQDTLNIKDIPNSYINITSGLGKSNPSNILIVPLTSNNVCIGAIELASFNTFDQFQVDFVEKVSESITMTIATVDTNLRTVELLNESQELAQKLKLQEEDRIQNLEELQLTQDELEQSNKETRRLLKETQNNYNILASMIDNSSELLMLIDQNFKLVAYNLAFQQWVNRTNGVKISVGVNLLTLLSDDQAIAYKANFKESFKGEHLIYEERHQEKNVGYVYWEHTYIPFKTENGMQVVVHSFNVTKRKERELELIESNKNLQNNEKSLRKNIKELNTKNENTLIDLNTVKMNLKAINDSAIGHLEIGLDGNILYTNPTFAKFVNYNPADIVNESYKMLLYESSLLDSEYMNFWKNLREGNVETGTYKFKNKFGENIWLKASFTPIKNNNDEFERIVMLGLDVTVEKFKAKAEEEKIHLLESIIRKMENQ